MNKLIVIWIIFSTVFHVSLIYDIGNARAISELTIIAFSGMIITCGAIVIAWAARNE